MFAAEQLQEDSRLMDFLFHFVCFPSVQFILAFHLKPNSFHLSRMCLAVGAHVEDTNTSSPALIMCCISCWFSSNHIWALLFASLAGTLKRWPWVSLVTVLATQTQSYHPAPLWKRWTKINCNIATTSSAHSSDVTACRGRSSVALSLVMKLYIICSLVTAKCANLCKWVQGVSVWSNSAALAKTFGGQRHNRTCKNVKVNNILETVWHFNASTMNVRLEPEIRMWLFLRGRHAQWPAVGQWEKHWVGVAYLAAQISFWKLD